MAEAKTESKVVNAWRTDLICKCGSPMYYTESIRLPESAKKSHVHKCGKCERYQTISQKFPKLDFSYEAIINEPIKHTPNGTERTTS